MNEIEKARKIINETDKKIAELFCRRMEAAKDVAMYKSEHGLPILDAAREQDLIAANSALIKDDVFREYYINFLQNMMDISKAYQHRLIKGMKVAYSGVEGAFAHIASGKIFPDAELISCADFKEAYMSVVNGECDSVVLPLENSYAGEVGQVTDLLFSGSLFLNGVYDLAINQNLLALPEADITDITNVYSHPQALAQCSSYIRKHGFLSTQYANTAMAAQFVKESGNKALAAIASEETAELYGLKILERNINKSRLNTTKFGVFSRSMNTNKSQNNECIALVFTVKNEAGSLAEAINIIGSQHKFNMRTLRSRPMKELLWQYYFYAEIEGNVDSAEGRAMLDELSQSCDKLKIVGKFLPHQML